MKSKLLEEIEQELQDYGYTTTEVETVDGISRGRVDHKDRYTYFAFIERGVRPESLLPRIHEQLREPDSEFRAGG
jgi:hypothetical protein